MIRGSMLGFHTFASVARATRAIVLPSPLHALMAHEARLVAWDEQSVGLCAFEVQA